eukprot:scaffold4537_cov144-Isochrysis_galbana.AAC.8
MLAAATRSPLQHDEHGRSDARARLLHLRGCTQERQVTKSGFARQVGVAGWQFSLPPSRPGVFSNLFDCERRMETDTVDEDA